MFSKAEAIANNNDLLTQILARLPVKSLLSFKSVSKHWYSLISDPAFSRRVSPDQVSGLILHTKISELEFVPLGVGDHQSITNLNRRLRPSGLRILQSCNGLLLCRGIFELPYSHVADCIYNPTMGEFVELPPSDDQHYSIVFSTSSLSLAFDPTISPQYKVVGARIHSYFSPHDPLEPTSFVYQIEIYSSKTRSWKLSGNPFVAHKSTSFCGGVFWNGSIHWIDERNRDASLYFNVEEERLEKLPMPDEGWEELEKPPHVAYFGECGDHLHLIQLNQPYLTKFDVFEMERDYSRWFVKYRVDLDAIRVAFPDDMSDPNCYSYVLFCVVREANEEDSYLVLHIPGKVIHYNFSDGSFKTIFEFGPDDDDEGFPFQPTFKHQVAYQFIPTLTPLKVIY